jgi:two-component system response regulator AlgR
MQILIVDDELLARQRLRHLLEDLGEAECVQEAENGLAALNAVQKSAPDLVLMDVRMPVMDGLEAAHHLARLERAPLIVFTTAYDEHALAAFDAQAVAYLLKPVRSERLEEALERTRLLLAGREASVPVPTGEAARQHLSALVGGELRLMPVEEVLCFQADGGYVGAIGSARQLLIEDPLRELEEEFADDFVRVHRNALIRVSAIRGLGRDDDGNLAVEIEGLNDRIPVSRRLVAGVRRRLVGGAG